MATGTNSQDSPEPSQPTLDGASLVDVLLDTQKRKSRLELGAGMAALNSICLGLDWEHEALRRDTERCDAVLDHVHGVDTSGGDEPTETDAMRSQMILGDVTVHQYPPAPEASTAAPGGVDVKDQPGDSPTTTAAPAATIGRTVGQLVRAALLASVGGTVLGAVLSLTAPGIIPADPPAAAPPPVAAAVDPPDGISPPEPAAPPATRQLQRRIMIGP